MKNNNFQQEFEILRGLQEAYHVANEEGRKDEANEIRNGIRSLVDTIDCKGDDYARTYRDYAEARENGNEYIDLHETIWEKDVPDVIERLRKFGIEKFTFSSTWSSAIRIAWLFTENGCRLEGLIQINGDGFSFGEQDRKPAYLFSIQ